MQDENTIILLSQLLGPKTKQKIFHKIAVSLSALMFV